MSVVLGILLSKDGQHIEVEASNYDDDELRLVQGVIYMPLDRRQMQELSVIIDRFMEGK